MEDLFWPWVIDPLFVARIVEVLPIGEPDIWVGVGGIEAGEDIIMSEPIAAIEVNDNL